MSALGDGATVGAAEGAGAGSVRHMPHIAGHNAVVTTASARFSDVQLAVVNVSEVQLEPMQHTSGKSGAVHSGREASPSSPSGSSSQCPHKCGHNP